MKKVNGEKLFRLILKSSKKQNREILTHVHWNESDSELAATDGRGLMVITNAGRPEGKYITEVNEVGRYPNYAQIVPGYQKGQLPKLGGKGVLIPYGDIIPKLKQAEAVLKEDTSPIVSCHVIDKRLELSCLNSIDRTEWSSCEKATRKNRRVSLNATYFLELMMMFHKLKEDEVMFHATDDLDPVVLLGDEAYVVIMPMRID